MMEIENKNVSKEEALKSLKTVSDFAMQEGKKGLVQALKLGKKYSKKYSKILKDKYQDAKRDFDAKAVGETEDADFEIFPLNSAEDLPDSSIDEDLLDVRNAPREEAEDEIISFMQDCKLVDRTESVPMKALTVAGQSEVTNGYLVLFADLKDGNGLIPALYINYHLVLADTEDMRERFLAWYRNLPKVKGHLQDVERALADGAIWQ